MRPKLLAVDDDLVWLEQVPDVLNGIVEVTVASTIDDALAKLSEQFFDICLLDLNFENDPRDGLDVYRTVQMLDRGVDVIMLTAETAPERIMKICNFGAKRILLKNSSIEKIRTEVRELVREREERRQVNIYQKRSSASAPLNPLMGSSKIITQLRKDIQNFVEAGVKYILIQGETGTGKDALAKHIAYQMDPSLRFLPFDCSAVVENLMENQLFGHVKGAYTGADTDQIGIFEAASGGFVFLDEIGEMPLNQQAKFLRVLQERTITRVGTYTAKPVNFRIICATHVDLKEAVTQKKFREDLFYRISRFVIRMPTLRERREDIPMIIESFGFKTRKGEKLEFSSEALELMKDYRWPGNIRQLSGFVESLAVMSESSMIRPSDIYRHAPEFAPVKSVLKRMVGTAGLNLIENERKKFLVALDQAGGSRDEAAKILGLSRATFFRRVKDLGLAKSKN